MECQQKLCCTCGGSSSGPQTSLPLICLVPRDQAGQVGSSNAQASAQKPGNTSTAPTSQSGFKLYDEDYLKKHFNLPQRALYLDPFRRPLITFPLPSEGKNFSMFRKSKINQQILDGFLDPNEAITAPSVFPYAKTEADNRKENKGEDEEIIYILQLPDYEYTCPVHKQTVRTPRFIWHSCKKEKEDKSSEMKRGGGPMKKPKPWLLSRHTDFDLMSQW